jgi:hypothetical protein
VLILGLQSDALQWVIEESLTRQDPIEHDPVRICRRIVRLNMYVLQQLKATAFGFTDIQPQGRDSYDNDLHHQYTT